MYEASLVWKVFIMLLTKLQTVSWQYRSKRIKQWSQLWEEWFITKQLAIFGGSNPMERFNALFLSTRLPNFCSSRRLSLWSKLFIRLTSRSLPTRARLHMITRLSFFKEENILQDCYKARGVCVWQREREWGGCGCRCVGVVVGVVVAFSSSNIRTVNPTETAR